MGITYNRLWTLLKYYDKLSLPNSTAMVAVKIGIHTNKGIPIEVHRLHLDGTLDDAELELEYLESIGLLRRQRAIKKYFYFDLNPLYRTLDGIHSRRHITTRFHPETTWLDNSTARLYIEKALGLLGEFAITSDRRREIEDWRYLAEEGLSYLLKH